VIRNRNDAGAFDAYRQGVQVGGPAQVGEPFNVGMWWPRHAVTLVSATAVLGTGSAAAATAVTVCQRAPGAGVGGAETGRLSALCSAIRPVRGARLPASADQVLGREEYLVVTVVPLGLGDIDLRGVQVSFETGGRRGSQHTGIEAEIRVTV
jgi:hypothetical protein